MALTRQTIERAAGAHIRQLQQQRPVGEQEKRQIRHMHERIANKVDHKSGQ